MRTFKEKKKVAFFWSASQTLVHVACSSTEQQDHWHLVLQDRTQVKRGTTGKPTTQLYTCSTWNPLVSHWIQVVLIDIILTACILRYCLFWVWAITPNKQRFQSVFNSIIGALPDQWLHVLEAECKSNSYKYTKHWFDHHFDQCNQRILNAQDREQTGSRDLYTKHTFYWTHER